MGSRGTRRTGVVAVVAGLALMVGCSLAPGEQPTTSTAVPADAADSAGTATTAPAPGTSTPAPDRSEAAGTVTVELLRTRVPVIDATATRPVVPVVAPARIQMPALDIDMPVTAVGIAPDGQMEIPEDALVAGWYRFGPSAGAGSGAAVIAAHAGSYVTPVGPFHGLGDAAPGDAITVTLADGTAVQYQVESVERLAKDVIDLRPYFERAGDHRLVLITCGGRWDAERQSYDDNFVVTARVRAG
ncbi:class F sortase [Occultella aeris]|uniref:Sortase family protein n=1 Tax=Occultella aeris TaxID=2761496 RepID=A0A7M4DMQ8_9MICO|nr:class F sortase [Occultella aeris]VZO38703.1 Sortase family protein [Occultella aeris]